MEMILTGHDILGTHLRKKTKHGFIKLWHCMAI